jgi:CspA family cold shock protein
MRGSVKNWFSERGFGFLKPDDGSADVFCHIKSVKSVTQQLHPGDVVEYDVRPNERDGRLAAVDVRVIR